jgi:rubrerythrin
VRKMTEENVKAAFAGESQASMKYQIFADKAEKEYPNIARLFRALSFAERVHATNHFRSLGGVKGTEENLDAAISGEDFEVEEMYPAYLVVAKLQEEEAARRSMDWAYEAEKVHRSLYERAKGAVVEGQDMTSGQIQICGKCGWTVEGQAPDVCPLCNAKKERFQAF